MTTVLSIPLSPVDEEVFRQAGFDFSDLAENSNRYGARIQFAKEHKDKADIGAEQREFQELFDHWSARYAAARNNPPALRALQLEFREKWTALQAAEHKLLCHSFDKLKAAQKEAEHLQKEVAKHGGHHAPVFNGWSAAKVSAVMFFLFALGVGAEWLMFDSSRSLRQENNQIEEVYTNLLTQIGKNPMVGAAWYDNESPEMFAGRIQKKLEDQRTAMIGLIDKIGRDGPNLERKGETNQVFADRIAKACREDYSFYKRNKDVIDKMYWYFEPAFLFHNGKVDVARLACPVDVDYDPHIFRYPDSDYTREQRMKFIGVRCGKKYPDGVK